MESSSKLAKYRPPERGVRQATIRLILVEEDDEHRNRLFEYLSREGFAVEAFATAGDSLLASIGPNDDVVLLGSVLPTVSGVELLSRLYRIGINPFVVHLDGDPRLTCEWKSVGQHKGSAGSSSDLEMLARSLRLVIDAIRPQAGPQDTTSIVRGGLLLTPGSAQAFWKGVDVGLTLGEFRIVQLLALNFGRYLSYDAIFQHGHSQRMFAVVDPRSRRTTVRSAVKRIRTKLRRSDLSFNEIDSYAAFGYRWGRQD
jgi:two-component system, OmpR family, response regulator ChvI